MDDRVGGFDDDLWQDPEMLDLFREGLRSLLALICGGSTGGWRRTVAKELLAAVDERQESRRPDDWLVGAAMLAPDTLLLRRLGPAVGRCAGQLAEGLARSLRLPAPVAVPIGCVVGALAPVPFEAQLRAAAFAIDAIDRGLGLERNRAGHQEPARVELDESYTHLARERGALVTDVFEVVVGVSLGIPIPEESLDRDRVRAVGFTSAAEPAKESVDWDRIRAVGFTRAAEPPERGRHENAVGFVHEASAPTEAHLRDRQRVDEEARLEQERLDAEHRRPERRRDEHWRQEPGGRGMRP